MSISCPVVLRCGFSCFNWSHLFEGQLAGEFEAHHHHTSNPEEQDVMSCLKQGARVKDIQVLGLKKTKNTNIYHKITLLLYVKTINIYFGVLFIT